MTLITRIIMSTIFLTSVSTSQLVLLTRIGVTQNDRWRQILVLRSTRADVERILGKAKEHAFIAHYPVEDGMLHIEYSDGRCKPGQYRAWKVAEGTVIELLYVPDKAPKFSSLHLDLRNLRTV